MTAVSLRDEISSQLRRRSTRVRLLVIFTLTAALGTGLARAWARSHFHTVCDLLRTHQGYEGVSIGYSGFGSLLISMVERRGTFFVRSLSIARDREILQRSFEPGSRFAYPNAWPARMRLDARLDDFHIRIELIASSRVIALVLLSSLASAAGWLLGAAWLEARNRKRLEAALADMLAEQARQVAHDIRSPLAALEAMSDDIDRLPDGRLDLMRGAIGRIREIANSLLDKHRAHSAQSPLPVETISRHTLSSLISPLVTEKRLRFRSKPEVLIEAPAIPSGSLSVAVQPIEFKRMLSNLIDNAVEALTHGAGTVRVSAAAQDGMVLVSVQDDGAGIAPEILTRLGRRGETHGKAGGSGLGLHHARTCAEHWGGRLDIISQPGKGTTVILTLPLADRASARTVAGAALEAWDAVLIDDDPLTRATWQAAAARYGKKLRAFAVAADFFSAASAIDPDTPVYVDSDLGEGPSGAEESRRINELGFRRVYLATGHEPSKFSGLDHLRGVIGKTPPWS